MRKFFTAERRTGLFASVGMAALVLAAPVAAQEQEQDEPEDEAVVTTEKESDNRAITVTGSRIRLPNLRANEPTTTIDAEYINQRNFINIADALNDLPQIRGSVTPDGAQAAFGQGVNFINNFGLGTNRSLTLVNGRRIVSSNTPTLFGPGAPGLQVDLNIIPVALIKATDIASTAGAPTYGSDAIAGTVNIILDDEYEGLNLIATSAINDEGDGFNYRLEGVYGTTFGGGRGNIQVSSFYTQTTGILQSQRQLFLDETTFQPNLINDGRLVPGIPLDTGPRDGIPATVAFRDLRLFVLSNTGVIFGGPAGVTTSTLSPTGRVGAQAFQFNAEGNLVPYTIGTRVRALNPQGVSIPSGNNAIGGDGFRFSDFGQLTSDLRRFGANLFANYDVTDRINVFVEAQYYDARADELVQQPTFNTPLFGGVSSGLSFDVTNPFLNAQARGVLQSAGVTRFTLSRANVGFADLTGFGETELLRGVVGARGDLKFGERNWNWEVSLNYGNTDVTDFRQDINAQNFINATNVALNPAGQIVCAANLGPVTTPAQTGVPAPVADAQCVPFNFFGNQASQAAIDYVIENTIAESTLEQVVINANLGGVLFSIFGNDVGVNVGYEHRRESGAFTPSEFEQRGRGRGAAVTPISGSFNLDEVFGEINMPLIQPSNDRIIESLIVYARGRHVDNTVNGGFLSWAAGGSIAIIPDIEFRGNFTRSFRAPALAELFLPQANAFATVPDLCMPGQITGGPNPAARQRNCQAFLARFPNIQRPQQAAVATVPIIVGGDPNLLNEQSDSWSIGAIIQPTFIRNFNITVDYINIGISNPIAQLTSGAINSACFDNDNFNLDDPANGNAFCSRIRRLPNGEVVADPGNPGVRTGFVNGNAIDYEGIVAEVRYSTGLESVGLPGSLSLIANTNVTLRRQIDITGVAPQRSDGTIGDPTWAGQFNIQYFGKNWGIGAVTNYIGEQLFSRFDRNPDARQFDRLEAFTTTDFNMYFDAADDFRLNFVVNNAFDRRCQLEFGFCLPGGAINDAFGRRYSLQVNKRF